jgi:NTP pyrophosphatase (non-canonical NTP hydrolase)
MPELAKDLSLKELQAQVRQMCADRGWNDGYETKFLLFTEEVGELAKAMRQQRGLYAEAGKDSQVNLAGEFADVLSYLADLANVFGVDLEDAYRAKDEENKKRTWV